MKRQAKKLVSEAGDRDDIATQISQVLTRPGTIISKMRSGEDEGVREAPLLPTTAFFCLAGSDNDIAIYLVNALAGPGNEIADRFFDQLSLFVRHDKKHIDRIASRRKIDPARFLFIDWFSHRRVAVIGTKQQQSHMNVQGAG